MTSVRGRASTFPAAFAWLAALVLLGALVTQPGAARAAAIPPGAAGIQARMIANLAAGKVAAAAAGAESLVAASRPRFRDRPLAEAGFLDTLSLRFFDPGTAESWAVARKYVTRALALREKILGGNNLEVAANLSMIAKLDDFEGRWAEGLPLEQRSLAIRTQIHGERHPAVAASRRQIGLFLLQLGRYAEAEPMLDAVLAIYDSLPGNQSVMQVDALNNLAELSRLQDRYGVAVSYFERGLAIADHRLPPGNPWGGILRSNLAGIYKDLGRYDDAEPLLASYLDQLKSAPQPDPELLATSMLNLAEVYRLQDRAPEAEPLYSQALALARKIYPAGSPELVPFVSQAAAGYQAVGAPERAEPLYRETLAQAERALGLQHPLVAQSLHDLGVQLAERGRYAEAADSLGRALAIRTRVLGDDHPDAAATRVELARALSLDPARGDPAAAPLLERAIAVLDRTTADPAARLDAHALRAQLSARAGATDAAIADMAQAVALVDTLRATHGGGDQSRGSFMARHLDLYHRLVTWRLERGDVAGALEAHERARARILLDQLSAGSVDLRAGIPVDVRAPLEAAERDARTRLAQSQRRIGEARMRSDLGEGARLEAIAALEAARDSAAWDLQRAQETLKERSPLWRETLSAGGRTASLAGIQHELLAPGELMTLYHTGADGSFLFVIPAGDVKPSVVALAVDSAAARELRVAAGPLTADKLEHIMAGEPDRPAAGSAAPIAALLAMRGEEERTLASQRVAGGPGLLERRLSALMRAVVPDAAWKQIIAARAVVVVPDGALHLLPFEALVTRIGNARAATRYWLDDGPPVRYVSSASSLAGLMKRAATDPSRAARPQLLSVSNPDYAAAAGAQGGWPPLPGTARETETIRRAFAPDSILVREGRSATEARVRAALPGRRFLHFATHGFVTERQSDVLAGLVLTPSDTTGEHPEDDGYLQLYEIYELPLACDLAVLSACGTQRGQRVAGEGVFALSRGFLAAGARRVVASLWEVNDASTAELMGRFFTALAGPARAGRDPDYALLLRDAKRRLRADPRWADPFYWAPFTLSGPL